MQELKIEASEIPGLYVLRHGVQYNDDGWFKENWHREDMVARGLPDFDPVQHNVAHSLRRGITRGFLAEPWDRLVSVTHGRAMGVWVDLRTGAGYGRTVIVDLDRDTSVFVPRGVATAHQVLEDDTTFHYLLEHHWTPAARDRASVVNLFDPSLAIPWPLGPDRAIVSRRDSLYPPLSGARPMPPRRILVVGTETSLGRALVTELPGADGIPSASLAPGSANPVDLSAYSVVVGAYGDTGTGALDPRRAPDSWDESAARAHRLSDVARRHRLRYVHVSADCVFANPAPEHTEGDALSLVDPHGQALAAGEVVAAGHPRHLIVRTGWVIGRGEGFVESLVAASRHGESPEVIGERHGRLTFAGQLASGITHLLDVGAPAGTYNVTGDGRAVTWGEVARRVYESTGSDPGLVREVAGRFAGAVGDSVLGLDKVKATGFRPGNSWMALVDHLPGGRQEVPPRPAAAPDQPPPRTRGPYKVLFVCTANICRSAYADVVARAAGMPGVEFASAGTSALVGEGIDPPMAAHVAQGDPAAHRARQLTRELVADADLILAMSSRHRRWILDEWPEMGRKAFVIGHVARESATLPDGVTLEGLVDHLWRNRTTAPGDDVADPYARGPEAAAAAADAIDGHLAPILEGLGKLSGGGTGAPQA